MRIVPDRHFSENFQTARINDGERVVALAQRQQRLFRCLLRAQAAGASTDASTRKTLAACS